MHDGYVLASEVESIVRNALAEAEKESIAASHEMAVNLSAGYIGIVEELEIACEPDERRGAEIAKRQILDAVKKAASFMKERYGSN